jgi:hypothetical protein
MGTAEQIGHEAPGESEAPGEQGSERAVLHGVAVHGALAGLGAGSGPSAAADRALHLVVERARPVPDGPPEGVLVLDTVVDGHRLHWAARQPDGWLLRVPGICDLAVDRGLAETTVRSAPGVTDDQLLLLVRGLLVAFVLTLAGECVLHASAVAVDEDGGAVAFAGRSGAGKSTLAALCCAAGRPFVTDDLLRIGVVPPSWLGTAAELRLRPGVELARLGGSAASSWPRRDTPDGRVGVLPPRPRQGTGPLRALVLPEPTTCPTVHAVRLPVADAAVRLAAAHRIVHWRDPAILGQQLGHAARLAEQVPVLTVAVPWGPTPSPGLADDVLAAVGVAAAASATSG